MKKFDRNQMAARVARDIPEGAYVNLGIGLPTLVADFLPKGREIILHSENGVLGLGPKPAPGPCQAGRSRSGARFRALAGESWRSWSEGRFPD